MWAKTKIPSLYGSKKEKAFNLKTKYEGKENLINYYYTCSTNIKT